MESVLFRYNRWLSKRMFLVTMAALAIGFLLPMRDTPLLRQAVIALFAYMTLVTSLETSLKQFGRVLARPWVPLWILFLVHIVTPLLAWGIGTVCFPGDDNIRLGYLVCASLPVGVTSVIWASLAGGSMTVALVAVTLDTLVTPVILPLFFLLVLGHAMTVDYAKMFWQLLWMITIPSLAGMALKDRFGEKAAEFARGAGGLTAKIALTAVISINAALVFPAVDWGPAVLGLLVVTFFMVVLGYLLGYAGALVIGRKTRDVVMACIYCVGLRNISAGLVLALTQFPPEVAVPMTLVILYQQPIASVIPWLYNKVNPK